MNAIAKLHRSPIGSFHWLAARLENFTLPRTGGIICISDYVKNLVKDYGVPTWIVPNAIQKCSLIFPGSIRPPEPDPCSSTWAWSAKESANTSCWPCWQPFGKKDCSLTPCLLDFPHPAPLMPLNSSQNWKRRTGNMAVLNISQGWMTLLLPVV